jgi:hypothetical protein
MAIDTTALNPGGSPAGKGPTLWTYKSSDTLTDIAASGYFNSAATKIETGDTIIVYSSAAGSDGGTIMYRLVNTANVITTVALTTRA